MAAEKLNDHEINVLRGEVERLKLAVAAVSENNLRRRLEERLARLETDLLTRIADLERDRERLLRELGDGDALVLTKKRD